MESIEFKKLLSAKINGGLELTLHWKNKVPKHLHYRGDSCIRHDAHESALVLYNFHQGDVDFYVEYVPDGPNDSLALRYICKSMQNEITIDSDLEWLELYFDAMGAREFVDGRKRKKLLSMYFCGRYLDGTFVKKHFSIKLN